MNERKPGWYWVKFDNGAAGETWMPAHWNNTARRWNAAGIGWDEEEMIEIGPRIPTPDEPWQCVPKEATADMLDIQTLGYHTPASKRWRETLAVAPKPEDA